MVNPKLLNELQESFVPKPTAKTAKRTRPDEMWLLFVKACGGRCCVCFKDGPIHRGHIQRHADGGLAIFENLIPLCKSCNGKYNNGFTPDSRPAGWRDAFWKLLLAENQIGLRCTHPQQGDDTLPGKQAIENSGLLDLRTVEFVPQASYITPSAATPAPRPMLPVEAAKLVWALFEKSKGTSIRPKRPLGKRQDAMKLLAIRHGREAFLLAGEQFLWEEPYAWVVGNEERGGAYAAADSWQHFVESFDGYLADGRARAARLAERAKADSARARVQAAEAKIAIRERRWRDYLLPVTVPDWEGMPDADHEHRDAVIADKDAEVREVTEENLERSYAVLLHYTLHKKDELLAAKEPLREMLAQCKVWAKDYDLDGQRKWIDLINPAEEWLDKVNDIQELKNESYRIESDIYNELDPARREAETDRRTEWEKEIWQRFTAEPPPGYAAADVPTRMAMWEQYREERLLDF